MESKTGKSPATPLPPTGAWASVVQWFDTDHRPESETDTPADRVDWVRCVPFVILHLSCLAVFFVGWSWIAVGTAAFLYLSRMFAITAFYHRYFSHRTFRTSRIAQFLFALWGATAVQRGALWWAHHHRHHHNHSDEQDDAHSPHQRGFLWSHIGWFTCPKNFHTDYSKIKDFARYPELVFLNRFDTLVPFVFALALFLAGDLLARFAPGLGTTGPQMLVWGFFVSTMVLFHCTAAINSLAHVMGSRRYETDDHSRNSLLLALATLGEGWHNNHHHYKNSVRQGFYWWEIDITFYILKLFQWLGIVWDLRPVPARVYDEAERLRTGRVPTS